MQQIRGFEAEKQFGLKGLEAQTDLEKSNIWTRKDLAVADLQALQAREGKNIEIDRHNAEPELWGRKINEGSRFAGGAARAVGEGIGDTMAPRSPKAGALVRGGGRLVGGGIEIVGSGADLYLQYRSIENRAAGRTEALNAYTDQAIRNQGAAAGRFDKAQDLYRGRQIEGRRRRRKLGRAQHCARYGAGDDAAVLIRIRAYAAPAVRRDGRQKG